MQSIASKYNTNNMAQQQGENNYFKPLTGVRAIAAYMVFIHHFNPFTEKYAGKYLYNFTQEFHAGVTIFFVLSGFLIAYRYLDIKTFCFKKYMVNRIARIYPMYFLLTTLTFLTYSILKNPGEHTFLTYILNITFLKGFFENFKFSGIAQGWSLTVEETFYILAPLLFLALKRSIKFIVILPILLMATGIILVVIFSKIEFYGFFSTFEFMFNYTFFGRCFEFFAGIMLALLTRRTTGQPHYKGYTYIGVAGILISIFLMSLCKGSYDFGIRHPLGKIINTAMLPLIGIVPFFFGLMKEKTILSKLLGNKIFVLAGKSSYVFYLIHVGVISSFIHTITTNYLLVFLALNILSVILFLYVENPLNHYIRARFAAAQKNPSLQKN